MSVLALAVIGLAFFLGTAWMTAALGYPLFSIAASRWPGLARGALFAAALPVVAGVALALTAFLPGDPHLDHFLSCHCATSMPGWLHLCPLHPTTAPSVLLPALAALGLLVPGRVRGLAALLREPLGTGAGADPTLVDLPTPMALLAGWLRPSLLVDRRLWDALQPSHRQAVLAHERAHLARQDPLVLAVLRLLTSVAPKWAADRLTRQWLDHAELRADASAASELDRFTVAEALVACARVSGSRQTVPQARLGWTAGSVDARVRALLARSPDAAAPRPDPGLADVTGLLVVSGAALASLPWLHHQVEHLINLSL